MLDSLRIKNFRCFEDLEIESLGRVNLIVGKNNVGKSTFLEATTTFSIGQNIKTNLSAFKRIKQMSGVVISRRNRTFAEATSPSDAVKLASLMHKKTEEKRHSSFSISNIKKSKLVEISFKKNKGDATIEANINDNSFHFKINEMFYINPEENLSKEENATWILDELLGLQSKSQKDNTAYAFSNSNLEKEGHLDRLFDNVKKEGLKKSAIRFLQSLDNRISDIDFINLSDEEDEEYGSEEVVGYVTLDDQKPVLLANLGEGISRLLQIYLNAIQARGGYLMIDEFENGLHYSIQEEVWEKLFQLAEELDIQVFATTHSQDTIKSFCKVATDNEQIEGKLISLGRSAKTSNKGQIMAVEFDEAQLKLFVDSGMEVRG